MRLRQLAILIPVLTSLAGCLGGTSPSSRLYALDSYHPDRSGYVKVVAVGPFELPDYLNRPQIVSRGANDIIYAREFERWAEPLDMAISRRIAGNIGQRLPTVFAYEFTALAKNTPDLRVLGQIRSFEARSDGQVTLAVTWTVRRDGTPTGFAGHHNYARELQNPGDTGEIVRVMGELIDELSADISADIGAALGAAAEKTAEETAD